MSTNEEDIGLLQVDHRESLSNNDFVESRMEDPLPVDDIKESTEVVRDEKIIEGEAIKAGAEDVKADLKHDSNPDMALGDAKDTTENKLPVDNTMNGVKTHNANEDIIAEKIIKFSARKKADNKNEINPDSDAGKAVDTIETNTLKKVAMIEQKEIRVRTEERKEEDLVNVNGGNMAVVDNELETDKSGTSDDVSINGRSAVHSSDMTSPVQNNEPPIQNLIPGAFPVEKPMHENSIRQEILHPNRSVSLTANGDTDPVVDETYDFRLAPTASVVLASSSAVQQSLDDPELGQHVVEAVCVQDQNVVEARIVTDEGGNVFGRKCSIRTLLFVTALLLLGIMTTALIVVLTKRNQEAFPTEEPTAISLHDDQRIDTLREILAPLSGENVFDENSTEFSLDRRMALDWMVHDTLLSTDDLSIEWRVRQRYVIALFYISTNGSGWKDQFYFDTRLPECDWSSVKVDENTILSYEKFIIKGVICNRRGRVERIRLWWNNLSGTLPHELSEFSESLVEFNIGGGSISGHIPRSFEQLTNLKSFACNDNCLTGVIPDLSDAIKLEKLWLSNNDGLSGSLNNFCSGPDILAPMSEVLADAEDQLNATVAIAATRMFSNAACQMEHASQA
eukprot:CAMPEP_0116132776 /NCGR_PEP_ID=MMETSP0329-20121206/9739_1 /TAXON_ID=697910 /ORGANISM="Pseudo-nitzschia arenysensis, Strain B593" /LENGTH=621 /DNA_ID=CAMNT_0003627335 /DNA_START=28 /DNA_END=1894 /DNA_ORIENTATION=-